MAASVLVGISLSLLALGLTLLLGGGILVLLVLRDEIVHVGLGLSEFHLVHALTGVPVQESLATEHGGELLADALEQLLDGSAVADEGAGHLQATWWDVADGSLDVVGDPLDEVARVLVLDVEHLLVNLLHGHAATEDGGNGQVTAVTWVAGSHHVLGVEHLLGQLGHSQGTVLLGAAAGQWSKAWHEEVKTWEWNHVHSQLAEISVKLTWEAQAGGHTRHGGRHEMVQVTIGWGGQLEGAEANVVQGLVVNAIGLVGVLDKLMHREGGVVWLNDGVGNLWRWAHGERVHDSVWVFLADLGDQQCSETGPRTTTTGVGELEALEAVAALSLLADDIENRVNELSTLGVVTLGPVVTGTALSEDEVVWAEDLTEWASTDRVHGAWLEVDKDGAWHVLATGGLVVVHVDALQLEVRVTLVGTGGVDAVLVGDDLPELGTDLVTALT